MSTVFVVVAAVYGEGGVFGDCQGVFTTRAAADAKVAELETEDAEADPDEILSDYSVHETEITG